MKKIIAAAALAFTAAAFAQGEASAPAPSSAAKKELVQKVIALQQPALEGMARNLTEQPARQMLAGADEALQTRVAPDRREAVTAQIRSQLRKYLDEAEPLVRDRALKIGQASLAPLFEEKFSEDELRQLLAALESPAYKKFQQTLPAFSNTYVQKLLGELRPMLDPKLKALDDSITATLKQAMSPTPAKPAASAASSAAAKPAKK